ncbi:carbon-nitrogen family hydrolase [Kyrpidia sp.]|uniref:carbon-nitrogen family hydrolase n=1 Tax=Kyrpidia sp. TaxID=2073077 RepID=UPI00258404D6|nr:carbon-nitrogen family hydrolase [Kyrpidia sp.]MCL6577117.1 carbon-nitrogen family hydrolase [Kyrpidia sp.]
MRVALCQMEVVQGDRAGNRSRAEAMVRESAGRRADVVVLPEMWTCGYDFAHLSEHTEEIDGETATLLGRWARQYGIWLVGGSFPIEFADGVSNTALTFAPDGTLVNLYRKIHLIGLMDEDRYLVPGETRATFALGETGTPDSTRAGVMICYDLRFPELARAHVLEGAEVLFLPAEWPVQRADHWRTLLIARAIENQAFVIGVNIVGRNDRDRFTGGSLAVDPWGRVVTEAGTKPGIVYADLDLSIVADVRQRMTVLKDRRPKAYL